MPVPLRTPYNKAEAKYNVTTEFPSLGLHSAAATGNVGLVEYALDHGQPINSVLDGVLPLHAACAGGSIQVVKLLIEHGADVNAPRLPRRYSNEKNRDSSAPIVGTSGSTPLHFAAANGNAEVVTLLLLHGAHANRADKHGITPETLAKQNGWLECATVLHNWVLNKDRDLREREGLGSNTDEKRGASSNRDRPTAEDDTPGPVSIRRRLHMKQSIDNALNMLKSSSSGLSDACQKPQRLASTPTPPASPQKPFGEYTFYTTQDEHLAPVDVTARRPSLPHILHPHSDELPRDRKVSGPATSNSQMRRPRSAGTDAERQQEHEQTHALYGRDVVRKIGSKYSLLNLFKKGQSGEGISGTGQDSDAGTQHNHPQSSTTDLTDVISLSSKASPPTFGSSFSLSGMRYHRGSDASLRNPDQPPQSRSSQLLHRKLSASTRSPGRMPVPLASDQNHSQSNLPQHPETPGSGSSPLSRLNVLRSQGHSRHRSGSSSSLGADTNPNDGFAVFAEDENTSPGLIAEGDTKTGQRVGILRPYSRTLPNPSGSPAAFRTLRFQPTSTEDLRGKDIYESPRAIPMTLKSSSSSSSLNKFKKRRSGDKNLFQANASPLSGNYATKLPETANESNPRIENDIEEADEEYGRPIGQKSLEVVVNDVAAEQIRRSALLLGERGRGLSFTSSSESSLSPILSNDEAANDTNVLKTDFPFSISDTITIDPSNASSPPTLLVSTLDKNGSTSSSKDSDTKRTDSHQSISLQRDIQPSGGLNERRAHTPMDINVKSISSHAQAEALLNLVRQDVLEMANAQELPSTATSVGRTPLSAKLAAYGEILALEKKFREQKEAVTPDSVGTKVSQISSTTYSATERTSNTLLDENNRQFGRSSPRTNGPRRPSTAEEARSRRANNSFSSDQSGRSHQSSCSTSAFGQPHPKPLSSNEELDFEELEDFDIPSNNQLKNLSESPQDTFLGHYTRSVSRTRMPVQDFGPESLSRISSLDGIDADTDADLALSRVSTAPHGGYTSARSKREQVRSAKKLTRMGLPPSEQAGRNLPPSSKRFGAIKSLIQTFKGKP